MNKGFGLLEVIIALALLALGMLSLVHGILRGQQHGVESLTMAQADSCAVNIYERMQVNLLGVKHGDYYLASDEVQNCNPCEPSAQAQKDLNDWQAQLMQAQGVIHAYEKNQIILLNWQSILQDVDENQWILYGGL